MAKTSLLELLTQATQDDLAEIDAKITSLESSIEKIEQEIAGLRVVRKAIGVKLNGKPERKTPTKAGKTGATKSAAGITARDRIYDYLSNKKGGVKSAIIAADLQIPIATVYAAVNHEWFSKDIATGAITIATTSRFTTEDDE